MGETRVIYWIREIVGWLLLLAGLYAFLICMGLLAQQQYVGAGIMTSIGFVVFRGGIHLVKVATAARVVLDSRRLGNPLGSNTDNPRT